MKKISLTITLCLTIFTISSLSVEAAESSNSDTYTERTNRGNYHNFTFKSYPPKNYKGLTLVATKKVKDGYIGVYL